MSIVDVDPYLAMQWDRWLKRRSSAARDHLIVSYAPLVKFVAGRVGAGLPVERRPGRPGQLRGARADRRHRALRSAARREVRDVRHATDPRGDLRRAARPRLGAAVGPGAGEGGGAGDRRTGGTNRPVADRRRARRPPPDLPRPVAAVALVDRLDHDRPARAGPRRRRRTACAERGGADGPIGRGRGARGPRPDALGDRQAARPGEARPVAVLRRGPDAWPRSAASSASARAASPRSTPSRCSTSGRG